MGGLSVFGGRIGAAPGARQRSEGLNRTVEEFDPMPTLPISDRSSEAPGVGLSAEARRDADQLALAVVAVMDQHKPLFESSRNLGYYRTEVDCTCGATLFYGDHSEDPDWEDVWAQRRADDLSGRGIL